MNYLDIEGEFSFVGAIFLMNMGQGNVIKIFVFPFLFIITFSSLIHKKSRNA